MHKNIGFCSSVLFRVRSLLSYIRKTMRRPDNFEFQSLFIKANSFRLSKQKVRLQTVYGFPQKAITLRCREGYVQNQVCKQHFRNMSYK